MSEKKAAQHKERHKREMSSQDVVELYGALERLGIRIWIDGGWGVDALLGKQSRAHQDLDIAIQQRDLAKLATC